VKPKAFEPSEDDIIAMVDVDYYVDMPKMLANHFNPVLLYTFTPSQVAKADGEYKYLWLPDNTVRYTVSGGGEYVHGIWDYDGDSIKVRKRLFGVTYGLTTYLVERKRVDDDHHIVLLAPLSKHKGFDAWLADRHYQGRELERFTPVQPDGFVRMMLNTQDGLLVATGKANTYATAVVTASQDAELHSLVVTAKNTITLASVKSKLAGKEQTWSGSNHPGSEILYEFLLRGTDLSKRVISLTDAARNFQWVNHPASYDQEARPSMVAFMQPIINGAFSPALCKSNDERMVTERITKITNTNSLTDKLLQFIGEFVDLFVGDMAGKLHPVDLEKVWEKQSKATQQRILEEAECVSEREFLRIVRAFMKREGYLSVTDPRNISQICGPDKRDYMCFMYALHYYLETMPWFAFGRSNKEIAARVAEIALLVLWLLSTDFSRMDGRTGAPSRELEVQIMMKLFHKQYHAEIYELMMSQQGLNGVTKFGVWFLTLLSRLSGSGETCPFNTITSACVAYSALRMTRNPSTGKFYSPEEAWARMGMYGGDDGITGHVDEKTYRKSAELFGHKLTCDAYLRGTPVKFLSRYYGPDVWNGDSNSCADIKRAVSKFHTTVTMANSIMPEQKLADKAYAAWLTDRNTPILGDFVSKAVVVYPVKGEWKNLSGKWMPDPNPLTQYPNVRADWMLELMKQQLPGFNYEGFLKWLETATPEELLKCPQFMETPPVEMKEGIAIVDGDVHSNLPPSSTQPSLISSTKKKQKKGTSKPKETKASKSKATSVVKAVADGGKERVEATTYRGRKPKAGRPAHQTGGQSDKVSAKPERKTIKK